MHPDWGLIVAVVSIVLIIPGGVVATMLTPKVERWWATTSKRRMVKRRVKLNAKLHRLEQMGLLQLAERRWRLVSGLCLSVYCMAAAPLVALVPDLLPATKNSLVVWLFSAPSQQAVHRVQILLYFLAAAVAFSASMGLLSANVDSADKRLGRTKRELAKLENLLGPPQASQSVPTGSGSLDRFVKQ